MPTVALIRYGFRINHLSSLALRLSDSCSCPYLFPYLRARRVLYIPLALLIPQMVLCRVPYYTKDCGFQSNGVDWVVTGGEWLLSNTAFLCLLQVFQGLPCVIR